VGRASVVAGLWSEVLGVDQVGLDDNFFDLGGDSRSVGALVARLNIQFGAEMRVVDFMSTPTVNGVTSWLDAWTLGHSRAVEATTAGSSIDLGQQAAARARIRDRRRR
jgi:hypothetical protein